MPAMDHLILSRRRRLLPIADTLRAVLKGCSKGAHPGTKKDFPPIGRARIDELNRPDMTVPLPRKDFSKFSLACEQIRNRKIILAEEVPKPCSCKQVTGVLDWL